LEKVGVKLGKKFIGENIEAAEGNLRVAKNAGGDKGKERNQGDGAKGSEIGNGDGEGSAFVLVESFYRDF
jgi:hypothetical protein